MQKLFNEWNESARNFELPTYSQLPDLELYMDQVISLMSRYLSAFSVGEEDKVITPSMINNYVKLGFSSALSGSYQAAKIAFDDLKESYPERKFIAIDTLAASMGEGLIVIHAAKLREEGKSIDEVAAWVTDNRLKVAQRFTVDDLFFLKRGGRVSGATAFVGTVLKIKPVLHVDNEGRLIPLTKVRGRKASLDKLAKQMLETAVNPSEQTVCITHGDCLEDAEYLASEIKRLMAPKEIIINFVDPVIGAHSGPGTIALFFFATGR